MTTQTTTITALFDSRPDAEAALDRLIALGLPVQNLHLTAGPEDEAEDSETRPLFDRLAEFLFPDPDQDLFARGVEEGSVLVTATTVPLEMEPLAVQALDDAGAVEITDDDAAPHEDSASDVAGAVTSATRDEEAAADGDAENAAAAEHYPATLGEIEAGTSGMSDQPRRPLQRRQASTRRVRSYGAGSSEEEEEAAVERNNLPG